MKMSPGVKEHLWHFDKGYSQDIIDFATNNALSYSKYMFVTTIKRQQYGYCTHCNIESPTHIKKPTPAAISDMEMCGCPGAIYTGEEYEKKKHGQKTICPNCGSECIVKYAGLGHSRLIDYAYFVYYEKSNLNPKMIVARGIYAARDYTTNYKHVMTELDTEVYYTFEYKKIGKMIKPISNSWKDPYHLGFSKSIHSWPHPYTVCCYSRGSIKNAVKDTPFAWSGWENYNYKEMTEFFDLYSRYPVVEYLTKLGLENIVKEKLETGGISSGVINWRGKTPESVLKLTKDEIREIRQNHIKVTSWFLLLLKDIKDRGQPLTIPEVQILSEYTHGLGEVDQLKAGFEQYMSFRETIKYCLKQVRKGKSHYHSFYNVFRDWQDYVFDCKKLNIDLSEMRVRFPNDLYAAHQNTINQIKYAEDKALTEKIVKRLPELSYLYFKRKQFIIRPAESSAEIVDEGKALSHCVGRYAKAHAEGETCILFIRRLEEPDKPYFTVEVNDNKIKQIRGNHNCSAEDEALLSFIESFKKHLTKKPASKKKSKNKVPA